MLGWLGLRLEGWWRAVDPGFGCFVTSAVGILLRGRGSLVSWGFLSM